MSFNVALNRISSASQTLLKMYYYYHFILLLGQLLMLMQNLCRSLPLTLHMTEIQCERKFSQFAAMQLHLSTQYQSR